MTSPNLPGGIRKAAHEAWCGQCGHWESSGNFTKAKALRRMLRRGWAQNRYVGLLCPKCALEPGPAALGVARSP